MRNSAVDNRRWRIGELAEAASVTVRTLHHYEEVGLLASAERTSGDHRLYDEAGVERLYRIRSLRELGMSVSEIRKAINAPASLKEMLTAHLARVEQEVERVTRLRERLQGITRGNGHADADDLLATLDAMSRIHRYIRMRRRSRKTGDATAEMRWRELADELRACMEAGHRPSSKPAKVAALKARSLIKAFAGDDSTVLTALARLRVVDPPANLAGWNPELIRYLDRAMAAPDRKQHAC